MSTARPPTRGHRGIFPKEHAKGVSAIDTTTPGGRLIFHIFGALGQFERDLIRERTRAGLDAAMARAVAGAGANPS
jgi:DNA invertase Pin-like site-specific DNA recombinase